MSPLSIVAVAIVATLFALLLLAAAAAIVYGQLRLRRDVSDLSSSITGHRDELRLTIKDIGITLESHRVKMNGLIDKINGQEIAQAAKAIIGCTQRVEKATVAFAELTRHLLSEEAIGSSGSGSITITGSDALARAAASGLGPESYAPNPTGERYTSVSRTAQGDIEAADELDNDFNFGIDHS